MSIPNSMRNFFSTLGENLDLTMLQGAGNKGETKGLDFPVFNFDQQGGLDMDNIEATKNEYLEAFENFKSTQSANAQQLVQTSQEKMNVAVASWQETMDNIKSTLEAQMEQYTQQISAMVEEYRASMDEVVGIWQDGQARILEKVSSSDQDTEAIKKIYDEMLEKITTRRTDSDTSFGEKMQSIGKTVNDNQVNLQELWAQAVEKFQSDMGNK